MTMMERTFKDQQIPGTCKCRHCGSTKSLLIRHPHTGKLGCLPCIREREPELYKAIARYTREYPLKTKEAKT